MRRNLAITAAVLGMVWLIATGVLLFYVAGLVGVPWLLAAFVAMDGAFLLLLAVYLVTNTRRPFAVDPYAQTTDDLLRSAVLLPDGRPYGRRDRDDRNVVDRLSEILEEEAARQPPSDRTPPWAIEIASEHARAETPQEEL
jgi:hypothetical protein